MADSDLQSTEERQVTKPPKLLGSCTSAARGRFGAVGEAVWMGIISAPSPVHHLPETEPRQEMLLGSTQNCTAAF